MKCETKYRPELFESSSADRDWTIQHLHQGVNEKVKLKVWLQQRNENLTSQQSIQFTSIPYTHVHRECEKIEKSICPKLSYKKLKLSKEICIREKYIKISWNLVWRKPEWKKVEWKTSKEIKNCLWNKSGKERNIRWMSCLRSACVLNDDQMC